MRIPDLKGAHDAFFLGGGGGGGHALIHNTTQDVLILGVHILFRYLLATG